MFPDIALNTLKIKLTVCTLSSSFIISFQTQWPGGQGQKNINCTYGLHCIFAVNGSVHVCECIVYMHHWCAWEFSCFYVCLCVCSLLCVCVCVCFLFFLPCIYQWTCVTSTVYDECTFLRSFGSTLLTPSGQKWCLCQADPSGCPQAKILSSPLESWLAQSGLSR